MSSPATTLPSDAVQSGSAAQRIFRNIVAGSVCGFLAIVLEVSFANLLFPNAMRAFVPVAIGMMLFSTMVLSAISALTSPIRGPVSVAQEVPIVAMSGIAGTIASSMAGVASEHATLVTIVAATMLATIATGLALLLLGHFRLGGLIRFVPFPVTGGFLAGTGWLILLGGITVILGEPLGAATIGHILAPEVAVRCALALTFVAAVALVQFRSRSDLVFPIAIFVALIAYNVVVAVMGFTPDGLRASGWLLPLPPGGVLWPPIVPADLSVIDWSMVLTGVIAFPGVAIVTVMALLMNATGIELETRRDIDLDKELRSVGIQTVVSGVGGGVPGYPAVSLSLLASRLGAQNHIVGLIVAALLAAALLRGGLVLSLVPTPLLGSLLLWVGGSLIIEWLISGARRLPFREYLLTLLIFLVIAAVSFAWGILVGLVAAVVLFVLEYGRIETIRHVLRGSEYQSNADDSEERRQTPRKYGDAILILRLQGYLFFGTADRLRKRILNEIEPATAPGGRSGELARVRFVLIDFNRVSGLDSSAVLSFARLIQVAERDGFTVVLTGTAEAVHSALTRGLPKDGATARFEADLEHGLSWCESRLLDDVAPEFGEGKAQSVAALLSRVLKSDQEVDNLVGYCERVEIAPGTALLEQGGPSNEMYFVESGRAAVLIESVGGKLRIAGVGLGAIVGEVAFYLGKSRTASVVAEEPIVAWRFTRAGLDRLQNELPGLAVRFHEGLATTLAERLTGADRLIRFFAE
jgi:sulfate permease, SulP family